MRPSWRQPPRVIAHRGAPADATENTLRAFDQAILQGARAIELDARLTRDGEVVVHHDRALGRIFPGDELIEDLDLAHLAPLRTASGDSMPTLRDVLARLPSDVLINAELKPDASNADDLPAPVHAIVEEHGALDRVLVTSFDGGMATAYAQLARRPAGLLCAYELDVDDLADWPLLDTLVLAEETITPQTVAAARHAARRVFAWTVNDARRAADLLRMGVDAIITDRPATLLAALGPAAPGP